MPRKIYIPPTVYYRRSKRVYRKGYYREDTGAPGKTPPSQRWYGKVSERAELLGIHSGFKKSESVEDNASLMRRRAAIDVRRGVAKGPPTLTAAKRAQALSNVSADPETKRKASAVADRLYEMHRSDR